MSHAENKADRLLQIEALLLAHPEGLTQADIARRMGVNRSTIHHDMPDLGKRFAIIEYDDGRITIDRSAYLVRVSFSLHEALAVHLASRLLSTRMDRQNPNAAAALRKLGLALERLAPRISQHVQQSADIMDESGQRQDPRYLEVLENLTLAWAEQRKAQVWHRNEYTGQLLEYLFAPYFIEPYAVGQTTHLIGRSDGDKEGQLRTLKIERIERVVITRATYEIPPSFDPRDLLADAWGVWYTGNEPVNVALKFHPRVARRVQETRWHRSEDEKELPDGHILWQAKVAEPQEMLPWIRGWGADVEVLEPESLRKVLIREAGRLARLYQVGEMENIPQYFYLWAKTDRVGGTEKIHPLIYHLLDVGECAFALWNQALSQHTRQMFSQALNLDMEAAGRTLAFWAALHDLGKAAPGFQRKCKSPQPILILEKAGFDRLREKSPTPAPHATISTWALKEHLLEQETGMTARDAKLIAFALGGHHGAWPTAEKIQSPALNKLDKGEGIWDTARMELLRALKEIYQPAPDVHLPESQDEANAFLTLFSGLVSVADWIGSMVENFPFMEDYLPAGKYISEYARQQASTALEKLGWLGWQADGSLLAFAAMFPQFPINDIQRQTIESAKGCALPALVILEAPTGIGKTEAALFLADTWLQTQKGKGIYIAMPTQATSNQMYDRVTDFLIHRYPGQPINTHLVHGAALLKDEETPQPQGIAEDEQNGEGNVKAETWFLPRKRTLLAPFGVGTVDQALMSVLQTNHFFVRMFGLGQKVVIFDEVHAYDTYMSTLFQRLLRWLHAIGTSVILLSATLPEKTRQELVGAWLGDQDIALPRKEYPRLTVVGSDKPDVIELPAPETRTLQLAWTDPAPEQIAAHIAEKLQDGGCAAIICNRVRRAQEIHDALKASDIVEPENLILFHARFPFAWRAEIEKRVLSQFGKGGKRPHKAIVVATQVIEQSLDLDFDYMLTDLAPIDLLLQRAGRLHRHKQNNPNRPQTLKTPCLAITRCPEKDDLPTFGDDVWVYERSTLLRTWRIISGRDALTLPGETSGLIEFVYGAVEDMGPLDPIFQQALNDADEKSRLAHEKEISQAKTRMVSLPGYEDLLTERNEGLEEDDSGVNDAFRALTRLAEPGVSLICLHQTAQGVALDADGSGAPVDIKKRPTRQAARQLLMRAINVQRREVVAYFAKNAKTITTAAWRESAAVRYHYPVVFDQHGEWRPEGGEFKLKLTRELGLEFLKKEDQ